MKRKRFQEANFLVKLWRCRWYITIPFRVFWYVLVGMKIYDCSTNSVYKERNIKKIFDISIGLIQTEMNWVYSSEEVIERISRKIKKRSS